MRDECYEPALGRLPAADVIDSLGLTVGELQILQNKDAVNLRFSSGQPLTGDVVRQVATIEAIERLQIVLADPDDIALLVELPILRELHVTVPGLTDRHVQLLCQKLTELRVLEVDCQASSVGDDGVAAIASLRNLRQLSIPGSQITDSGFVALLKMEKLKQLTVFGGQIFRNSVDVGSVRTTVKRLWCSFEASAGQVLQVAQYTDALSSVTDFGILHTRLAELDLAPLSRLANVTRLSLMHCEVSGPELGSLSGMTQLQHLNLSENPLGNGGLRYLPTLPGLDTLWVEDCGISTAEGLQPVLQQQAGLTVDVAPLAGDIAAGINRSQCGVTVNSFYQ